MLFINSLVYKKSSVKFKRLGRGIGSGLGKTCGKGHKGQKSRSGYSCYRIFEGGQTPFYRRIPKFGFSKKIKKDNVELHLSVLNKFCDNTDISLNLLKKSKIIPYKTKLVKIIVFGKFNRIINICDKNIKFSSGVRKLIELNNGKINY